GVRERRRRRAPHALAPSDAGRPLRRQNDPRPGPRRPRRPPALPLRGQGDDGDDRAPRRGRRPPRFQDPRVPGLAGLAVRPHLLPDRVPQPSGRPRLVGLELPAPGPAHPADRSRRPGSAGRGSRSARALAPVAARYVLVAGGSSVIRRGCEWTLALSTRPRVPWKIYAEV